MKKAAIALGVLVLLASPSWASDIGFMFSYFSTDQADEAAGGGFRLRWGINENVDVEVRATVYDSLEYAVRGHLFTIEALPVEFGIAYNFRPDKRVNPYIGGGGSYFLLDSDRVPVRFEGDRGRMENEMGWYVVGGLEFPVRENMTIFFEGIYRQVSATIEGDDFGASNPAVGQISAAEFDMDGGAFNLGISFGW